MGFLMWVVLLLTCPVLVSVLSRRVAVGRLRRNPEDARACVFVWRTAIVANVAWYGSILLWLAATKGSSELPALATLPMAAMASAMAWGWIGPLPASGNPALERAARVWFGGLVAVLALTLVVAGLVFELVWLLLFPLMVVHGSTVVIFSLPWRGRRLQSQPLEQGEVVQERVRARAWRASTPQPE